MKLLDLLTAPWAIQPDSLREIQAIYATHLRGDKIDIAAIEARLQRPLANNQQQYTLEEGGIAVLSIEGVIAPKANLFMEVSGGVSTQMATKQVESAIADPRVKGMVLAIDSGGGSVFGTPEFAATVHELAQVKPIVSVSDATMASAAYWIGAAASAVYITGPTVQVGSIGVVATHNYNPRNSTAQVTEITAGKYKRIASTSAPLTEEGKASMQASVDHLYSVFVDAVATYRGTSADLVLERMADGRVFIGQQAIDAGLVDGVATVDAIVSQMASNPAQFSKRRKASFAGWSAPKSSGTGAVLQDDLPQPPAKDSTMPQTAEPHPPALPTTPLTRASFEQAHPALFAQIRAEFVTLGAAQERDRIQAVRATTMPGQEQLVEQLAFDGQTTAGQAALAVIAANNIVLNAARQAHAADAPAAVQPSHAAPDGGLTPQAIAAQVLALHRANHGA